MFEPGDLVECVDAGPLVVLGLRLGRPSGLVRGAVYTVERARRTAWGLASAVVLREAIHPKTRAGRRSAFWSRRFRLLKRRDPELMALLLRLPEGSPAGRR